MLSNLYDSIMIKILKATKMYFIFTLLESRLKTRISPNNNMIKIGEYLSPASDDSTFLY